MRENFFRSILLPAVIIPVGGLLVLAICYLGYFALYMLIESVWFPNDPTSVPAGIIRNSYALALLVIYGVLLRTKVPALLKATIHIGPVTMLIIAAILALYLTPVLAAISTAAIAVGCFFLLYRYKKPWTYYYATTIATVLALLYAWPRA